DRRPPHAPESEEAVAVPEPGDYESAESKVLSLVAGTTLEGVTLECTNRVGQAHAYYAEDAVWKAQHAVVREERRNEPEFGREKTLLAAPIANWITKTNENKGHIQLKRIRLIEALGYRFDQPRKRLSIQFTVLSAQNKHDQFFE